MTKFGKQIGIGLLAGALVFTSPAVYAAGTKMLDVTFSNIKSYVDGKAVVFKDTNGKTVEPFVVDGTVYVPAESVAAQFGYGCTYDESKHTLTFAKGGKKGSGTLKAELADLNTLASKTTTTHKYNSAKSAESAKKDNTGTAHNSAVSYGLDGWSEYYLGGQYQTFQGKIGLSFSNKAMSAVKIVKIYGDGELLYTSGDITKGYLPEKFNIDVSGVTKLRIAIETTSKTGTREAITFFDAGFYI